jgi:hypothetical protein
MLLLPPRASNELRCSARTEHDIVTILRSKSNAGETELKLAKVLATLSECMYAVLSVNLAVGLVEQFSRLRAHWVILDFSW